MNSLIRFLFDVTAYSNIDLGFAYGGTKAAFVFHFKVLKGSNTKQKLRFCFIDFHVRVK